MYKRQVTDIGGTSRTSTVGVNTSNVFYTNTGFAVNTTTVIDSSLNATFNNLDINAAGTIDLKDQNGAVRGTLKADSGAPHFRISTSNNEQIGIYDGTTENIRINGSGDLNLITGSLEISGTGVIDSSRNLTNIGTISSGNITANSITTSAISTFSGGLDTNTSQSRVKISPGTGTTYGYGMKSGMTFGGLANNYALTFQMNSTAGRGFWWGTHSHTDAQGAMALTNDGKLTVNHSLRLGYGVNDTTTPGAHALDVSGSISASGDIYADGGNLIMGDDAFSADANYVGLKTSAMTGTNDYMIISATNDGNTYISAKDGLAVNIRGGGNNSTNKIIVPDSTYITATTSNFYCTGNVTAYYSSDQSLKQNIRVIDNPIEKIKQIRGVYFDWTDDYIKEQSGDGQIHVRKDDVGVIAQDVQPVLDEVVTTRDDGTLAVRYEKMVALCIEAIKEQQQKIEKLEELVEKLISEK